MKGHDWVVSHLPLDQGEDEPGHYACHNEGDDFGRTPGVDCTAKLQAEEHHNRTSGEGQTAKPVDCLDAGDKRGFWRFQIQSQRDYDVCSSRGRYYKLKLVSAYLREIDTAWNMVKLCTDDLGRNTIAK